MRAKARLIARVEQVDLDQQDLEILLNLLDAEHNRQVQQWAWREATETQRRRLASLQRRLIKIQEQLKC